MRFSVLCVPRIIPDASTMNNLILAMYTLAFRVFLCSLRLEVYAKMGTPSRFRVNG